MCDRRRIVESCLKPSIFPGIFLTACLISTGSAAAHTTLSATSLNFGNVVVAQTSAIQSRHFTNNQTTARPATQVQAIYNAGNAGLCP